MSEQYQVFFQPLLNANNYGSVIDVSDYVVSESFSTLERSLDRYDFDVGSYRFNNVKLKLDNSGGKFNVSGTDTVFDYQRDKTKVEIYFIDDSGTSNLIFSGLTNEKGTQGISNNDFVVFSVLSSDSILNRVNVDVGDISNGDTFTTALTAILNKIEITKVLKFDIGYILPSVDYIIDDVTTLGDLTVKECLNRLLFASNSVFYVKNSTMRVSDRLQTDVGKTTFYGFGDRFGRENIVKLDNYNSGFNSIYNSITINSTNVQDVQSITDNGLRLKNFTLEFITNTATETSIAQSYIAEFKNPKRELTVTYENTDGFGVELLDEIELNLLENNYNNIDITSNDRFKIIGITDNPKQYTRILKLREI